MIFNSFANLICVVFIFLFSLPALILSIYAVASGSTRIAFCHTQTYGVFLLFGLSCFSSFSFLVKKLCMPELWIYIVFWHLQQLLAYTSLYMKYSRHSFLNIPLNFNRCLLIILSAPIISIFVKFCALGMIIFNSTPIAKDLFIISVAFCPIFICESLIVTLGFSFVVILPLLFIIIMYLICKETNESVKL